MLSAYCVLFYCSLHLPCSSPLLCRFGSAHRAGLSAVSHENCPASSTFAALFVDPAWNLSACHFPCSFFSLSLFTILAHSCHTSSYGTKLFFCLLYALCLTPCIPALLPSSFIHSSVLHMLLQRTFNYDRNFHFILQHRFSSLCGCVGCILVVQLNSRLFNQAFMAD